MIKTQKLIKPKPNPKKNPSYPRPIRKTQRQKNKNLTK